MKKRIITLTTDFGSGSKYVAQMKGVILAINPDVSIIDLSHEIPPQDIHRGSLALVDTTPWFPSDSIHVAVIDPGVGTSRELLYAQINGHHYICPDNGLLDRLAAKDSPDRIVALTNDKYWLPDRSSTFHGRDVIAPTAAHVSLGVGPTELGNAKNDLVRLDWPEVRIVPGKISGTIQSVDSFGNLITDITGAMLEDAPRDESVLIHCDEHQTHGIFETYADQPAMTLIALIGSSGQLEIAIVNDSAKIMLGVNVGTPVTVTW